ncbi:MAG: cobalt-precorrin-5B (C(1))-methyltransferase [Dehalococcoidia bacterium]|nr:cobalt-precorrin-5B (C(1))-methyltransferase [Dehalococcoidia bacterium]
MGSRLEAVGLSFEYPPSIMALDRVDFCAEAGEFVAILGPNGSGKTTLLRHLNGLLFPTGGKVLVDGREVLKGSGGWLHRTVGFVFQDPNDQLFAATVGEDVAFGPRNLDLAVAEVEQRVETSLDLVGLAGFGDRPIHSLSFGQKRRAALAGVLAMQPSALVLDEPTAGLDPMGASRLMTLLHLLNRQRGVTIVAATHDIDLVPAYAGRVYIMHAGRVITSGPPPEVFCQTDVIRQSDLRLPRAAHLLNLIDAELGHSLASLPMTLEETPPQSRQARAPAGAAGRGFTTGAAAAAAARAASELLFHGRASSVVELRSPIGAILEIRIQEARMGESGGLAFATACVIKEAGDPGDVTDGVEIWATVTAKDVPGVTVDGGHGVGRVVRDGLPVEPGRAAINPVPRQMIADATAGVLPPRQGAMVVISVTGGEELASRTLNPAAGIVGGIAILGTTGVIERRGIEGPEG